MRRLGFMRFTPAQHGRHCRPIDPSYLSWRVRRALGQPCRFVELANDVNDPVERVAVTAEELAAADAVVLLTDHDEFDLDLVRTHARYVLDTRHRVAPGEGVEYV